MDLCLKCNMYRQALQDLIDGYYKTTGDRQEDIKTRANAVYAARLLLEKH